MNVDTRRQYFKYANAKCNANFENRRINFLIVLQRIERHLNPLNCYLI